MSLTLEEVNAQEHIIAGNGEIRICCPECDDLKFKCYVNIQKKLYNCYKCGYKGRLSVDEKPNLENWDAVKELNRLAVSGEIISSTVKKTLPIYGNKWEYQMEGYKFLRKRGLTQDEINSFALPSEDPYYPNCVIFPIYRNWATNNTQLDYFVCRKYDGSEPKYINAPWPKGETLGITLGKDWITPVICEGMLDAIAIARAGYKGVALLGKKATEEQISRLVEFNNKYIIMLDGDAFTYSCLLSLTLKEGSENTIRTSIVSVSGEDPCSLAQKDLPRLREVLNNARRKLDS